MASETSLFDLFGCLVLKASILSLLVEVDSGAVLPSGLMLINPTLWQPGYPDAAVSGPHIFDDEPTLDTPVRMGVGLLSFYGKAAVQALQLGLRFCA